MPAGTDPNQLTRTVVGEDFRAPLADQFSLEFQRQLGADIAMRIGTLGPWARICSRPSMAIRGSSSGGSGTPACPTVGFRQDPTRGVIRLRANEAESWYHSLQTGLDKRFSGGLSAGLHYTWSKYPRHRVRDLQSLER